MKNKGLRTLLSVAAAIAVVFFGSGPSGGQRVSNAVLALAVITGLLVWHLTRPNTGKPTG